jgi:hypothetical protein
MHYGRRRGVRGLSMTDEEKAAAIRSYIAGIDEIKKHPKGSKEYNAAMDRILLRLSAIWQLYGQLQENGRQDLWEEFREWDERFSE